MKIGTNTD